MENQFSGSRTLISNMVDLSQLTQRLTVSSIIKGYKLGDQRLVKEISTDGH